MDNLKLIKSVIENLTSGVANIHKVIINATEIIKSNVNHPLYKNYAIMETSKMQEAISCFTKQYESSFVPGLIHLYTYTVADCCNIRSISCFRTM